MKISIPFLATDIKQLPQKGTSDAIEAVIFNFEDLEKSIWKLVWQNIKLVINEYGSNNVTFHFPVNNSDYIRDPFVEDRLYEALNRASDLGMHGIIVHSNRIRKISEWKDVDLNSERKLVIDKLNKIRSKVSSSTFLALENMPIMDNYGIEIDPLFCFPEDFNILSDCKIGIVWDICHYSITLTNINEVVQKKQNKSYYPNFKIASPKDFVQISDKIVHWHFSGFQGIANPDTKSITKEGVIPSESYLGEAEYELYMNYILDISNNNQHIVFEIQDADYYSRTNIYKMINWFQQRNKVIC